MDPKQLDAIERWNLFFAVIFIAIAAIFFDMRVWLGMIIGCALSCANFYGIHKLLSGTLSSHGQKRAVLQVLLLLKMVVLMIAVYLAIAFLPISPVALAVGLSVFLLSIAVESIRFALGGGTRVDNGRA
jgi:hypothetical protein